jgi:hypothetical protein
VRSRIHPLLCLALLAAGAPAHAIDRIRVNIEALSAGAVTAHAIQAQLAIPSNRRSVLTVTANEVALPSAVRTQIGRVTAVSLRCENPAIREPDFTCPQFTLDARAARLPPLHIEGDTHFDSARTALQLTGRGPVLAGAGLTFAFEGTPRDWDASASLPALSLASLAGLAAPWYTPPPQYLPTGEAALVLEARGRDGQATATLQADLADIQYGNAAGTVVAEKLRGSLRAQLLGIANLDTEMHVNVAAGQLLAGPVYIDLATNPLQARVRGSRDGDVLQVTELELTQQDLARLGGTARVRLQPLRIETAELDIAELRFPAAYASLMQIALTTTPFAQLETSGTARGTLRIADNRPVAVDVGLGGLSLRDPQRQLEVLGLNADVHWTQGLTGPPRPSFIAWESSRGWGVVGGRTRVDFTTQDRDLRLLKPARLPLWDGALVVNELEALGLGTERLAGSFDARMEPVSLEQVTRAFGWPEFAGRVSGRVPGLTYRDRLLTLQGDLEAEVFDGRVTARNLRVRDPLGAFPRLYADVVARDLDLDLITRTFEFGNITGRLDGDLIGLETFNWSPVAFDLRLATPERDRSRHRISQKAVKNLANLGGGGGGVAAALQSGALRFFENFRYDRIGLACRLRDDVCVMSGVEPAKSGYYIVKGSGLPRIDIIGNQTRVDWPLLMAQISAALANSGDIVVE